MCGFANLTRKMFEALKDIKAGRFVFVVSIKASEGRDGAVEDVIIDETSSPQLALERHCKSKGISMEGLLCMPVILPLGLKADSVRGFRPIRTKDALWIEYTKEGPERPDRTSGR